MAKTLKDFLNERQLGPMVVKNPDEQKFIDKHVTAKTADRNGNGDEVFKGSKVKLADRRKERHGYNPGEDEKVYEASTKPIKLTPGWGDGGKSMKAGYGKLAGNQHKIDANHNGKIDAHDFKLLRSKKKKVAEEVEELDELSTPTLQSYRKKARAQGNAIVDKMKLGGGDWSKDQKDTKTLRKRSAGAQMSGKRLVKRGESLKTEEAEQIEESAMFGKRVHNIAKHYGFSQDGKNSSSHSKTGDSIAHFNGGSEWGHSDKSGRTIATGSSKDDSLSKHLEKRGYSLKEDAKQIDELSNKTLGSYVKKAKDQMSRSDTLAGRAMGAREHGAKPTAAERKHNARANKRYFGIDKAVDKMTKEEVEINEAHYEIDVSGEHGNKAADDFVGHAKKAGIKAKVHTYNGPGGGNPVVHLSHPDHKVVHKFLKKVYDPHMTSDQIERHRFNVKEEVQIDELDHKLGGTLSRYINKTAGDAKRQVGRDLALKKRWGDAKYGTPEAKVKAAVREDAEQVDEVLTAKTPMGTYIKDFQKSDAPQFKGKSKEKRRVMAIAAKLSAERGGKPLNKEERLLAKLADISETHKRTMVSVFEKLNEDNQRAFMLACDTAEGIEQMLDFSIQHRGE